MHPDKLFHKIKVVFPESDENLGQTNNDKENIELDFTKFIKELNKAIKVTNKLRAEESLNPIATLTKKDEFEWMELFEDNKKKAQELQDQIAVTEKEIDQKVYELYGLTEDEIAIVENS